MNLQKNVKKLIFIILKDEITNRILVIWEKRAVSALKKKVASLSENYNAMNDKKKLEVLLKVIKRIYDKNPGTQEMIDASIIEVCAEEGVSPEQVFFVLLLSLL